jgi:hypothetical protein
MTTHQILRSQEDESSIYCKRKISYGFTT